MTANQIDNSFKDWCIIILVYNEEKTIEEVVKRTIVTMDSISNSYSILAVDDGSRDKSNLILQDISAKDNRVRIIRHAHNLGIGHAIYTGITNASAENVLWMCSDLQFVPEDIALFARLAGQYEVILGARPERKDSAYRKVVSWGYHILMKCLFGIPYSDLNWVQMYKGPIIKSMTLECRSTQITTELILKARRLNARICELPTRHFPREKGVAKGASPGYIMKIFFQIIKLWIKTKMRRI
jgi:glycosyltransferase involved in cell wall biosynthesis